MKIIKITIYFVRNYFNFKFKLHHQGHHLDNGQQQRYKRRKNMVYMELRIAFHEKRRLIPLEERSNIRLGKTVQILGGPTTKSRKSAKISVHNTGI